MSDFGGLSDVGIDVYAGGGFLRATNTGGASVASVKRVANWDGSTWQPLGLGINSVVYTLAISGADVYAGGGFLMATNTGGAYVSARRVTKWDGSAWEPLGSGLNNSVLALAADSAGHLFLGGNFSLAGTTVSQFIVQAYVPPLQGMMQNIVLDGGTVALDCLGLPGTGYVVERATDVLFTADLTALLRTNAPAPDGLSRYTDSSPPSGTALYRLRLQ
jgi:hypothetical protein